ncbi:hypothetical protein CK203_081888 [Vitis vinifera]|uniref:Uncharacterized protein n=1 Tax=Vitis vinifera TaxID=29760 RepID=A0A438DXA6_VITVI|nr:hypothetical protein CK203_081888 [Vitis vinifera]
MACRTMLRSVFLTEPWRPVHSNRVSVFPPLCTRGSSSSRRLNCECRIARARRTLVSCSNGETPSSQDDQGPPQEAVLKAISDILLIMEAEVSKTEGRVGQTTNVVIGGTVTDDSTNEWLALDQKVYFFFLHMK